MTKKNSVLISIRQTTAIFLIIQRYFRLQQLLTRWPYVPPLWTLAFCSCSSCNLGTHSSPDTTRANVAAISRTNASTHPRAVLAAKSRADPAPYFGADAPTNVIKPRRWGSCLKALGCSQRRKRCHVVAVLVEDPKMQSRIKQFYCPLRIGFVVHHSSFAAFSRGLQSPALQLLVRPRHQFLPRGFLVRR